MAVDPGRYSGASNGEKPCSYVQNELQRTTLQRIILLWAAKHDGSYGSEQASVPVQDFFTKSSKNWVAVRECKMNQHIGSPKDVL